MSPVTQEMIDWYAQSNYRSGVEGEARGRAEGRAEGIEKVAKNMISDGADDEYVSHMTGLEIEAVKKLRASVSP